MKSQYIRIYSEEELRHKVQQTSLMLKAMKQKIADTPNFCDMEALRDMWVQYESTRYIVSESFPPDCEDTNQNVQQTASQLHIDQFKYFEYSANGMKEAWQNGINASAEYYDRMSKYNKETRGMSKKDRNEYYRDRNKEDGWFGNSNGN